MADDNPPGWLRRALTPLQEFLRQEATSGLLLLAATVAALAWANSPAGESYVSFTEHPISVGHGDVAIALSLQHWVNDLLIRASDGSKLLLVSLAIVDDILAIVVIAAYYTGHVSWPWLAIGVGVTALIAVMRWVTGSPWAYLLPAAALWLAVYESGIHPTIAGVVLGLLTPARPRRERDRPVLQRLEHRLHPYSVFLVVPLFALVNAGVDVRDGALNAALTATVTWAVVVGLVVGKLGGISAAVFIARRLRIGSVPIGMPAAQVWPVAALGGIGFTVALFVADLAFTDPVLIRDAKVGILIGSVTAGVLGVLLLRLVSQPRRES